MFKKNATTQEDLDKVKKMFQAYFAKYRENPDMMAELAIMCEEQTRAAREVSAELRRQVERSNPKGTA